MSLADDTALRRRGPGDYAAQVTDRWDALGRSPNGGYLLALAVRALSCELAHPDPVAVSAVYPRPGAHGAADIAARALKQGRRLSYGTATVSQRAGDVVHVHAAFADLGAPGHDALSLCENRAPALPPPDECVDLLDDRPAASLLPGVTIADRLEYRAPRLPGWRVGRPTGDPTAELWLRLRDGTPPTAQSLPLLVDAMAPVLLELGHGSTTVELTVHVRARPAAGWLSCRATTRTVASGFHEEDLDLWDSAGRLVAQARQLGLVVDAF